MMHKVTPVTLATACLAVALAGPVGADAAGDGRYQGVEASESAVWVVDTHTGKVRKCTQEFADQPPACTPFSD